MYAVRLRRRVQSSRAAGVIARPLVRRSSGVGCVWFPYVNTWSLTDRASVAIATSARSPGA
jgi:hypothetical protein